MLLLNFKNIIYQLFIIPLLLLITSCSSVPTTKMSHQQSGEISYYFRPGNGPTIVFQSGLGDNKSVWSDVLHALPLTTPVFAYDRPGYGDSPGVNGARDACTISEELHNLLKSEKIPPPYVIVGHSLGGLYAYCFAERYPFEVSGLVLIDPTHPKHWQQMQTLAPIQSTLIKILRVTSFSRAARQEFDGQETCLENLENKAPLNTPTKLLFSGKFSFLEKGAFESMIRELRAQWAQKFIDSSQQEVTTSGHYIQNETPEIVAQSIQKLVEKENRKPVK